MGIVLVDVCSGNVMTTVDIEQIIETEFPEVAVIINDCLSYCGLCGVRPFVLVNGKIVFGQTVDECLDKIREEIKKELSVYE
ncbi:MAG TPA: DUF1450 domain-containing protein [Bacillota bacterium]|nr:DUF1450 domain-containing protein [Bacillota bacterium]